MVCIQKYSDTFYAALFAAAAFLVIQICLIVASGFDLVILVFTCIGLLPAIVFLAINWRRYYLSASGITVVWFGRVRKMYPWQATPTVGICELWVKPSCYQKYFIVFLSSAPTNLQGEMRKSLWYETHPFDALLFPYALELHMEIQEKLPNVQIRYY